MREDTSHSIANLWSMENFHDLVALSQSANPISEKISEVETEATKIRSLERMLNSPYFARLDFKFDDEDTCENIYIGRSSLMDGPSHQMVVYDWRAPVSSVFYRFGTGKAFYEAPGGRITGEVDLKRQYEINNGKLEYFFDADMQIIDEFLRKLLSQNASPKMKTIVETIQKDQDIIIRDLETDLMMVQGVAGSGKTSVALHRVAYLMYRGLTSKLSSSDIVILSPNTLFEQYIANVLPELGEKNVTSLLFENILETVLQNESIQTRNQLLEGLFSSADQKQGTLIKKSMAFKGSGQFTEIIKRFIQDLPKRWIEFSDVYYNGKVIAGRQLMKAQILAGKKETPLSFRLQQLEHSLLEAVREQRKNRMDQLKDFIGQNPAHSLEIKEAARLLSIKESTALMKKIKKFTELNALDLYKKLFRHKDYFYRLAQGLELPDCMEEIIRYTDENLDRDYLQYDDALALAYFHLRLNGCTGYQDIKQVVIDEAQDYYPIHFEILNELFPQSRYTILGDINQTIGKPEDVSLYAQISRIFGKEKSTLVTMDKSFRCTSEILGYSAKFLDQGFPINSFSRNGDVPAVWQAPCLPELDKMIAREVLFCRGKDYRSVGLICKTEKDAVSLYGRLRDKLDIQLIRCDGSVDLNGVFAIPIYMAKGLEFDAVLICDADRDHFNSEDDKKLLYIACTRALHRLNLFYTGDISPLL